MAVSRYSNLHLLLMSDCMGFSRDGKCTWLNCKTCMRKECAFKRSEEECKYLSIYSFQRLASLEGSKQTCISDKYCSSRKPWKKHCAS